jgi:membrane fusion protein, multidrug efflux system
MSRTTVTTPLFTAETRDSWLPMIVIAMGQALMSLVNTRICSRGGVDRSVSIALSILVLASGCSRKAPAPTEVVVRPVRTMVVTTGAESHVRTFPGRVEASNKVELAFQVSGLLVSLPVREGQQVTANEVIAQLRPDEFQARLRALQGQLDRARADLQALRAGVRPEERLRLEAELRAAEAKLANARTEFDRFTQLLHNRVISRTEYDRAETGYTVGPTELPSGPPDVRTRDHRA